MAKTDIPTPRFDKPVKILLALAGGEAEVLAAAQAAALAELVDVTVEEIGLPRVTDLPQALALAERLQEYDGYVVLGAVIAAPELWADVSRALTALGMGGALNGNGLILAASVAEARAQAAASGAEAARSVLGLIALSRSWTSMTKGIGFRA